MLNNFSQINAELVKFIPNNTKPGEYSLDNILKFMDFLGNPQNKLKVIHIAGTSGKTSTAYYVASLLNQSGKKVGLSVSPHIHEINERYLIDLKPLPEQYFCKQFSKFLNMVYTSKIQLTYFEVLVAFAFWEFYNQKVDYAVIEVGLGGLLDCTNIISNPNKISVICDIGIDHVKFLGSTIQEIAKQKAGIIKPNNSVFINKQSSEIEDIIKATCKVNSSSLKINVVDPDDFIKQNLPDFQIRNYSLASSIYDYLIQRDGLSELSTEQKHHASKITINGRMQIIKVGNKNIILDGSHNPQKIESIVKAVKVKFPDSSVAILVGFKNNTEDIQSCLTSLRKLSHKITLTNFKFGKTKSGKSYDTSSLEKHCVEAGFETITKYDDQNTALTEILGNKEYDIVLVTGTFFLLSALDIDF